MFGGANKMAISEQEFQILSFRRRWAATAVDDDDDDDDDAKVSFRFKSENPQVYFTVLCKIPEFVASDGNDCNDDDGDGDGDGDGGNDGNDGDDSDDSMIKVTISICVLHRLKALISGGSHYKAILLFLSSRSRFESQHQEFSLSSY